MPDSKAGGYISQVRFKNGEIVELLRDDIVVFVGPNNAGKSQCLRDIYDLAKGKENGIVVSDVVITKYDAPLEMLLNTIARPQKERGGCYYHLLNHLNWDTGIRSHPNNFLRCLLREGIFFFDTYVFL